MFRPSKASLMVVLFVVVSVTAAVYAALPVGYWLCLSASQLKAGQRYMDSISEKDVQVWIDRTDKYLDMGKGRYGNEVDVPEDLKRLKIITIVLWGDAVRYVWLAGLDSTYLEIQRLEQGEYRFIGNYDDETPPRVLWPKKETANMVVD